jgi:hypothetical protein
LMKMSSYFFTTYAIQKNPNYRTKTTRVLNRTTSMKLNATFNFVLKNMKFLLVRWVCLDDSHAHKELFAMESRLCACCCGDFDTRVGIVTWF